MAQDFFFGADVGEYLPRWRGFIDEARIAKGVGRYASDACFPAPTVTCPRQVFYIRTDHIGRPVFATNDLGLKVWEASYLPFGGVHVASGGINLRFPGQWFQSGSGLLLGSARSGTPITSTGCATTTRPRSLSESQFSDRKLRPRGWN